MQSSKAFALFAFVVIGAGGIAAGSGYHLADRWRVERASLLVQVASQEIATESYGSAQVRLTVARALDGTNQDAQLGLGRVALASGQAQRAQEYLEPVQDAPGGSALYMKALALDGQLEPAAKLAASIAADESQEVRDRALAIALMQTQGLTTPTSASKGQESLRAVAADKLAAAQLLYRERLLNASQAIIRQVADRRIGYYQLASALKLSSDLPREQRLKEARIILREGIERHSADLLLRRAELALARELKDQVGATEQEARIQRLERGEI